MKRGIGGLLTLMASAATLIVVVAFVLGSFLQAQFPSRRCDVDEVQPLFTELYQESCAERRAERDGYHGRRRETDASGIVVFAGLFASGAIGVMAQRRKPNADLLLMKRAGFVTIVVFAVCMLASLAAGQLIGMWPSVLFLLAACASVSTMIMIGTYYEEEYRRNHRA